MRSSSALAVALFLSSVASAQAEGGDLTEDVTEVVVEDAAEEVDEVETTEAVEEVATEEVALDQAAESEIPAVTDGSEADAPEAGADGLVEESVVEDEGLPNAPEDAVGAEPQAFLESSTAASSATEVEELLLRARQYLRPEVEAGLKLVAVRSLASVRDERALPMILEFASSMDPLVLTSTSVRETFVRALADRLSDRADLASLESAMQELNAETRPLLVTGVARSGSPDAVRFLVDRLGDSDELDEFLLREVEAAARAGLTLETRVDDESLYILRGYSERGSSALCRNAIAALGSLHDIHSIPALIQRLADEDSFVSQSARSALTTMARADLGQDPALWTAWHDEQQAWWRDSAPSLVLVLRGVDPAEAHKALAELVQHSLWRHELADLIGKLAHRTDRAITPAICVALGQLGSRRAIPYLLEAVLSDEPLVQGSANSALQNLTGLELYADYLEWSRALGV